MKNGIGCKAITLAEAQAISPIPSGYTTSQIMHLQRWNEGRELRWALTEVDLATPVHKLYDDGPLEEWVSLYGEGEFADDLFFIEARENETVGLLTWKLVGWNNTVWLADIRVRESRRRNGVGSRLIGCLKREARKLGVRGVSVETQISNVPALHFYRGHGFQITGFNDALYVNDGIGEQDVAVFLFWAT